MKTRDHEEIREGMWVSDENGIYEVKKIDRRDNTAIVREIVWVDDDPEKWEYGDTLYRNKSEMGNCYYG